MNRLLSHLHRPSHHYNIESSDVDPVSPTVGEVVAPILTSSSGRVFRRPTPLLCLFYVSPVCCLTTTNLEGKTVECTGSWKTLHLLMNTLCSSCGLPPGRSTGVSPQPHTMLVVIRYTLWQSFPYQLYFQSWNPDTRSDTRPVFPSKIHLPPGPLLLLLFQF